MSRIKWPSESFLFWTRSAKRTSRKGMEEMAFGSSFIGWPRAIIVQGEERESREDVRVPRFASGSPMGDIVPLLANEITLGPRQNVLDY